MKDLVAMRDFNYPDMHWESTVVRHRLSDKFLEFESSPICGTNLSPIYERVTGLVDR